MKTAFVKIIFILFLTLHSGIVTAASIDSKKEFTMEIYNRQGVLVFAQTSADEKEFSIASLLPGEYKMLIFDENKTVIFYETIVKPSCMAASSF